MARIFSDVSKARVRATNRHRKSSPLFRFNNAGLRSSLSVLLWSLVALFLLFHLFSLIKERGKGTPIQTHYKSDQVSVTSELGEIEKEPELHLPPPRKRNPRAAKRRAPHRPPSTLVGSFLDESSEIHSLFFPDRRLTVGPVKGVGNNVSSGNGGKYFYPGRVWLDTDGNPIQAHGGGILFDEKTGVYYWYGENKDGPTYPAHPKGTSRVDIIGVSCYSSKDLWEWRYEGIVLASDKSNTSHDLHKSNVLERPKVVRNERTGRYVMWMHIDDGNYTKASVGVAVSDSPTGPFTYLYSMQPHGSDSRDMTLFKDDDGKAYLIYSTRNNTNLHVGPLTDDYLNVTGNVRKILSRRHREAPAVFKYRGTYYMITSACSGWAPNRALAHASASIMGPWETMGNPCVGGNRVLRLTTFFSQGTFVLPLNGLPGLFIFMADRWNPSDLSDSRYVWLPLLIGGVSDEAMDYSFGFPLWSRVSFYWHRKWRLPEGWSNG